MKMTLTGRHLEVTPSLREYAEKRIAKLEKYFHQLIDVYVIMSVEKLDHAAELLMNGDGVQFHAVEKAGDMYSSIDLLVDKMEKQIVKYKEKLTGHKVVPLRVLDQVDTGEKKGVDLFLNQVSNKPKSDTEAYLEMKMEGRDFILYKKEALKVQSDFYFSNKNYAVLYRGPGGLMLAEIDFDMVKGNTIGPESLFECDVEVVADSLTNPKLKLRKRRRSGIGRMSTGEAIQSLMDSKMAFLPFFNSETDYFNVVYKNGKSYEVMVPAF